MQELGLLYFARLGLRFERKVYQCMDDSYALLTIHILGLLTSS